jgi:nitrate reductase NapAB chaperone NapD
MTVSAILVIVSPAEIDAAIEQLAGLRGVDVHHIERATGRIIITQEAESIRGGAEGLKRIKALPFVTLAEMVHHNFEHDPEIVSVITHELEEQGSYSAPAFLED